MSKYDHFINLLKDLVSFKMIRIKKYRLKDLSPVNNHDKLKTGYLKKPF